MSIFDGTNTNNIKTNGAGFTAADKGSLTCSNTYQTPCNYASINGFNSTKGDTILLKFYNSTDTPTAGVTLSGSTTDPVSVVQVTITRSVKTTLMRLFGPSATTVKATAIAAIVTVQSPTPLLITDPNSQNSGTLTGNGGPTITICGGPTQSVQVNGSNSSAYDGGVKLDLSHAGPADTLGDCTKGTGASFGVWGGLSSSSNVSLGTTGQYLYPHSPVQDPFAGVTAPSDPGGTSNPATTHVANGVDGCTNSGGCTLYSPGHYTSLVPGNDTVLFKPGLYYVYGGGVTFKQTVGGGASNSAMCVGCTADANTGTGMLIYDTGPADAKGFAQTGQFNFGTNTNIWFTGPTLTTTNSSGQTVPKGPYYNITLWEDRTAEPGSGHTLGQGNGCFTVTGTVYLTNTLAIMTDTTDKWYPNHTQSVTYAGNPCSATAQLGDIIVSDLSLSGNKSTIVMNLFPYGFVQVRQVALVE
jgi:hypothetical protein